MYDDGRGGQIAQALVAAIAHHRDDADEVEAGQHVDHADQVSGHGFKERDLAARLLNDANFAELLARRLAVPEGLKQGEVAPVHEEVEENDSGDQPLFTVMGERSARGFGRG